MSDGWDESAAAWIADMGETGDYGRKFVLDRPMLARLEGRDFKNALDVGCGEGRFCRMLRERGIDATGIDPTAALIAAARARDPAGAYHLGQAAALPFADASFDLVISYLALIDIPDIDRAIPEMARVLKPGGTLLVANLTGFTTANLQGGWATLDDGATAFPIDRYLEERAEWASWRGIRIRNWHRPLSRYMSLFLAQGLNLRHFDEPAPYGGDPEKAERYRRVPFFVLMDFKK